MSENLKTIVLLNAEAVQTLIVAERLYNLGYRIHLIGNDKWSYGFHTRYASKRIIGPHPSEENAYLDFLIKYVKDNKVDALFPMNDESAFFLSKYKSKLCLIVNFDIPDFEIFQKGYDKNMLMHICKEIDAPHPLTLDIGEVSESEIRSFIFPALIKPNYMTGGRGMTFVNNYEEYKNTVSKIIDKYGACHLQQFIPPGGRQIKVEIFIRNGEIVASTVIHKQRFYPENGGSSTCNITISEPKAVELCGRVLKTIGWEGFADFDLIEDPRDGILKIMEINPRVPACIKSSIKSGVDFVELIVDSMFNKPLKSYNYCPGNKLRHIGFEVLWFLSSKNRFRSKPNWFNFFGPNLSFQDFSIRDPLPFFFGTIGNIRKQFSHEFRSSKAGLKSLS